MQLTKGNSIEDVGRIAQECCYKNMTKGNSIEDVSRISKEENLVLRGGSRSVTEIKKAYDQEVIRFLYLGSLMQEKNHPKCNVPFSETFSIDKENLFQR